MHVTMYLLISRKVDDGLLQCNDMLNAIAPILKVWYESPNKLSSAILRHSYVTNNFYCNENVRKVKSTKFVGCENHWTNRTSIYHTQTKIFVFGFFHFRGQGSILVPPREHSRCVGICSSLLLNLQTAYHNHILASCPIHHLPKGTLGLAALTMTLRSLWTGFKEQHLASDDTKSTHTKNKKIKIKIQINMFNCLCLN